MAKKKQEIKEETKQDTKKKETQTKQTNKSGNSKTKTTKNTNNKGNNKKTTTQKKNQPKKKKEKVVEEIVEVVEETPVVEEKEETKEEVSVKTNKEVEIEDQKEEKLSKTFIEKTKKLLDDHDEYVENALNEEEFEKTQEFENTQLLKIREALKPIGKQKKKRHFRKNGDIDEDFLDVNNKDEHLFLKLVLIVGSIALFIWLMPKIAFAIDEHFILDNEYEPYVPEAKDEQENKDDEEEKVEENIKSEVKLTEEEIRNMLNSLSSETLMLPTSTKDYTLTFEKETMEINSIECYIIDVSAIVDDEPNHIANFAVSIYGEKIFKVTTSGGYEEIKFNQ